MSAVEWLVLGGGLFLGFWVVSLLMGKKPAAEDPVEPAPSVATPIDPPAQAWHEVLGLAPDATPEQIRAAYREQISQYHPDKVASLGVELQTLAERKTKEIGQAYSEALRALGQPE